MPFKGEQLAECLTIFGTPCKFKELNQAPRITTYYFDFSDLTAITPTKLKNAVARLSMYAKTDFKAVNSGLSHFAICCAENNHSQVHLSTVTLPEWNTNTLVAGIDENNNQLNITLDRMIHGLIAGTTGSGKSVFIKNLLYTLCVHSDPNTLKFAIIDKKRSLNFFDRIGHSLGVANTDTEALNILRSFRSEMYRRYDIMQQYGIEKNNGHFPKWVLVIDELADLMLSSHKKEIEKTLVSLCQLARACGIHCILATQSPRADVLTGLIRANLPTKFIFKTASVRESVVCLDHKGAEQLLGYGDCLVKFPDSIKEYRVQTPFASDEELKNAIGK
jgi:DNA segregation ATPase FtsK/SpoIIIE-like protein